MKKLILYSIAVVILVSVQCAKKSSNSETERKVPDKKEQVEKTEQISYSKTNPPPGMRFINGGTFSIGDTSNHNEHSVQGVIISSFFMDTTEVTQEDYQRIMNITEKPLECPNCAVNEVSWFDAVDYCNAKSKKHGFDTIYVVTIRDEEKEVVVRYDKIGYRLPTEAEWEYACKANTGFAYSYLGDVGKGEKFKTKHDLNNALLDYEWFDPNSDQKVHVVAQKKPNPWGLYDMLGNVSEWCNDWFDPFYYEYLSLDNPKGPKSRNAPELKGRTLSGRVIRGGHESFRSLKITFRGLFAPSPDEEESVIGFRCVLPIKKNDTEKPAETGK